MPDAPPIRRQCQHIKDNGEQCKKNALPGKSYCNMESHRRAALWRTRIKIFGRKWWPVFIGLFTLAVGVPSLYSYSTRLSVVPTGGTIRAHEAMGTIFNLTNQGIFTIHNVTHLCIVKLTYQPDRIRAESTYDTGLSLGDLSPGVTKSLSCEHAVLGFKGKASIEIKIIFTSPVHRRTTRSFPFESEQADDGTWVWKAK
jgi:hypothetical protein